MGMIPPFIIFSHFQLPVSNTVGRMHTPGKGISSSALPYSRRAPSWLKTTSTDVVDQIHKLARRGMTPSQIGVVLRDSHGIPQVRFVTGNKILRILKSGGLAPEIPEDLYHLIKKVEILFVGNTDAGCRCTKTFGEES
jgi:hypothetical protein